MKTLKEKLKEVLEHSNETMEIISKNKKTIVNLLKGEDVIIPSGKFMGRKGEVHGVYYDSGEVCLLIHPIRQGKEHVDKMAPNERVLFEKDGARSSYRIDLVLNEQD